MKVLLLLEGGVFVLVANIVFRNNIIYNNLNNKKLNVFGFIFIYRMVKKYSKLFIDTY